jgi:protein-L-isoaspartate(D-aspartate) O-methyltransferase
LATPHYIYTVLKYIPILFAGQFLEKLVETEPDMSWEQILSEDDFRLYRENISLLEEQVIERFAHAHDAPDVLRGIRSVPRHLFVHGEYRYLAYSDNAFPTCCGLTTSAPSVIAEMIFHSGIRRGGRLLEIGTGTGYEAAVLAEMGVHVFTIEIDKAVGNAANRILSSLGYKVDNTIRNAARREEARRSYFRMRRLFAHRGRVELYIGNGAGGLPDHAPYDAIIVAAAVRRLEDIGGLRRQQRSGGRLLYLHGDRNSQLLYIVERHDDRFRTAALEGVSFSFLPLIG